MTDQKPREKELMRAEHGVGAAAQAAQSRHSKTSQGEEEVLTVPAGARLAWQGPVSEEVCVCGHLCSCNSRTGRGGGEENWAEMSVWTQGVADHSTRESTPSRQKVGRESAPAGAGQVAGPS